LIYSNGYDILRVSRPSFFMKTFKQTSDIPYDRHEYKIKFDNGKAITFPDYESMQYFWFSNVASWGNKRNAVVEVVDINKKQGFG